jgi:hypothetical protein
MLVGFKNTIVCKVKNKSRDDERKTINAKLGRCIKKIYSVLFMPKLSQHSMAFVNYFLNVQR